MISEKSIHFLAEAKEKCAQLSHASNIITKYRSCSKPEEEKALNLLIPEYVKYLKEMEKTQGYDKATVKKRVSLLNTYYNFMHEKKLDSVFSPQGKFRPTILEEFLFLLFKDYVEEVKERHDKEDALDSGSVKAYSNLYFKARNFEEFIKSPEIGINEKDQDYAIYRKFNISINDEEPKLIRIPAVAIEAKTYIDKTMLDSIIATAEKIKSGNPHTRFIAVSERYDVSYSVDPAYSRIDQIYVLRKSMRKSEWKDIDGDVVWKLVNDTMTHLERPWSDIKTRIENDGIII